MNLDWEALYTDAVEAFGSAPTPQLEGRIITAYEAHPIGVTRLLKRATDDAANGKIYSWGVISKRLDDLMRAPRPADAGSGAGRQKATLRAEQRIRNELLHYPTWTEAHDELFGHSGALREWPDLSPRLEKLWYELRPDGERVEREAEERAARYIQDQQRISQAVAAKKAELDQAQAEAPA